MNDRRTVPLSTIIATSSWALAVFLAVGSIAVGFSTHRGLTMALQTLAFVFVGLSVCLTVRCYAFRVMRLMRTLNSERTPDSPAGLYGIPT